eukprot:TRINITY_DN3986_c0_g1_i4.p1 TRINITY_DN3986_c0_g1~~TRINITY_DN3986_c0_g1_i4.p1  ORF type:complete len:152 (+),score=30.48 TRINITY_DN3986_c0_g1_i4:47-457(+)
MCIRDRDRIREEMVTKGGSIAVLVAEDEKMAQMVLNSMLKSLGAVATLTDDGSKCVKEFNANPKKYQIILMDFLMPTMNGIEATKEIRKKDPKIKIIGLSAEEDPSSRDAALKAGMTKVMKKPLKKTDLQELLKGL